VTVEQDGRTAVSVDGLDALAEVALHRLNHEALAIELAFREGLDEAGETVDEDPDDGSLKLLTVSFAGEDHGLTAGCHQFHCRDGSGQVPMAVSGPVCPGGAGACDGNMRQRSEVVEGVPFLVQPAGQVPVTNACLHSHSAALVIQLVRRRVPAAVA